MASFANLVIFKGQEKNDKSDNNDLTIRIIL